MLVALRRDPIAVAVPLLQLGALFTALAADKRGWVLAALAVVAMVSLVGWWRAISRGRLISDTPTSRIASAAQGYTELRGRGKALGGSPVLSPMNGLPVLWYRVRIERLRHNAWEHVNTVESDASFLLVDDSGECAVDPDGAEFLVTRKDVSARAEERMTQWSLIAHDPIYAIGDFCTLGSIDPDFDTSAQVGELLAAWKADRGHLLERFDLDGNGEIDLDEWALARAAARREIEQGQREVLAAPEAHVMRAPDGRRLYLISNLDPRQLARRHRWISLAHMAAFLAAAAAAAMHSGT